MSEYPECSVCLDIYGISQNHPKAPKMLSCGDSICKECLQSIIQRSDENFIVCPNCHVAIEKKNIDEYLTVKQLIQLVNSSFRIPEEKAVNEGDNKKPIKYQIIALGNSGVGKTCIFKRLLNEKFEEIYNATVQLEIQIPYHVKYKNLYYQLIFYDTCGQEKNYSLTQNFLRQSDGVLFVFDLSDKDSFDDLEIWYNLYKGLKEKVVGVLLGNKCDKKPMVDRNEIERFAEEHGLKYFETSAKSDIKIKKSIASLLKEIIESKALYNSLSSIDTLDKRLEGFKLEPTKITDESCWKKFCAKFSQLFRFSK